MLLGFDCAARAGQAHWFGNHPAGLQIRQNYSRWIESFSELARDLLAEGVEVINCSPVSALKCWPKMSVEEALAGRLPHPSAA